MTEKNPPPENSTNNLDFIKNILPELITAIVVTVIIGGAEKIAQSLFIPTSILAIIVILLFSAFIRTNRKSRKWLVVAGGIAMIAGFSLSTVVIANSSSKNSCANPMTDIFMVTNRIQQGSYITENDLNRFSIHSDYVIDSYILSKDEIIGQIAEVDIPEYSIVTKNMITARSIATP
jgi:hypothetical protein